MGKDMETCPGAETPGLFVLTRLQLQLPPHPEGQDSQGLQGWQQMR